MSEECYELSKISVVCFRFGLYLRVKYKVGSYVGAEIEVNLDSFFVLSILSSVIILIRRLACNR
jgi:hypothetical protein